MNIRFLIDRVVQQTTVLLAQLATSGGARAPLAELSNQMFVNLAEELENLGVSRKVSSDMFGMALRAYLKKLQRLKESSTDEGHSLWEAVLTFIYKNEAVERRAILERFHRDDEAQVRAVLREMVECGLVQSSGSGPTTTFVAAGLDSSGLQSTESFADLLWVVIFREGPISHEALARRSARRRETFEEALRTLLDTGRILREGDGEEATYQSLDFVAGEGKGVGWEAAVLDHFQGLVATICQVLRGETTHAGRKDASGGYTYAFDIWPDHPLADEVYGTLGDLRRKLTDLRNRVDAHNAEHGRPDAYQEVVVYGGQCVQEREKRRDTLMPPPPSNP